MKGKGAFKQKDFDINVEKDSERNMIIFYFVILAGIIVSTGLGGLYINRRIKENKEKRNAISVNKRVYHFVGGFQFFSRKFFDA